jgi:hypothetical protein
MGYLINNSGYFWHTRKHEMSGRASILTRHSTGLMVRRTHPAKDFSKAEPAPGPLIPAGGIILQYFNLLHLIRPFTINGSFVKH